MKSKSYLSPLMRISRYTLASMLLLAGYAVTAQAAFTEQRLDGTHQTAEFGYTSAIGDFNGDGFGDLAVGEPSYGMNPTLCSAFPYECNTDGRVYVYYGTRNGLPAVPDWIADSGVLAGASYFGGGLANAGDVNNDGIDDLLIGEPDKSGGGRAYLFLGSLLGLAASATTSLFADWNVNETRSFAVPTDATSVLTVSQPGDKFGWALSSIGDANGDNYDDIIIGAYNCSFWGGANSGAAYIYYGNATGLNTVTPTTIATNLGSECFGKSVAVAHLNQDTYPDLIVGADRYTNGESGEGAAFVFYGSSAGFSTTPDWRVESNQAQGCSPNCPVSLGSSVASAGDVNNDGYEDIIVGAWFYDGSDNMVDDATGAAFVFYGSATGMLQGVGGVAGPVDADWTVFGPASPTGFGTALAGGDLNGDGISDVIIGGDLYNNPLGAGGGNNEGYAAIYYGSLTGLSTTKAWSFSPEGASGQLAHYGAWIRLGDIDGDGKNDYAVSAYRYDVTASSEEGSVYVYLSRPAPALVVNAAANLTTTEAAGEVSFTVALNSEPSASVNVAFGSSNSSEGTVVSGAITFTTTNWNTPQTVTVRGKNDFSIDGDQVYNITFGVTSSGDSTFNAIGTSTTPVQITNTDDDVAGVTLTPSSITTEFNATSDFTVALTSKPAAPVTITLSSSNIAEGTVSPSSLIFDDTNWTVAQTATVTGTNPTPGSNNYTINLSLASSDNDYDGLTASVSALNSYSTVSVVASDANAAEPASTGTFTVSRDGNTSFPLTVNYTVSGTATSGVDFTALMGSVIISTGQTSATLTVTPLNDALDEADETVIVTIAAGDGYLADATSATVIIVDDDVPPVANFSANQSVNEGSSVNITVTLSQAALSYPVTVPYTISGSSTSPADHNAQNGVVTISSGTTGSVSFEIATDSVNEDNETLILTMGTPTNATVGSVSSTTITILNVNNSGGGNTGSASGGGGALSYVILMMLLVFSLLLRGVRLSRQSTCY